MFLQLKGLVVRITCESQTTPTQAPGPVMSIPSVDEMWFEFLTISGGGNRSFFLPVVERAGLLPIGAFDKRIGLTAQIQVPPGVPSGSVAKVTRNSSK